MIRRFERAGRPGDFFEVEVQGSNVIARSGPRGRDVITRTEAQASPVEAEAEMLRLVLSHLDRGFQEVAWQPPGVLPELSEGARRLVQREADAQAAAKERAAEVMAQWAIASTAANPALEAQCRAAAPDDEAPWIVYTDFLADHGDPRAEIAAAFRGGQPKAAMFTVGLHRKKLTGSQDAYTDFTFRHGFAVGAQVPNALHQTWKLHEVVATLLASPMGTFLDALTCGLASFGDDNDWRPTLEAVLASPIGERLRVLNLNAYDYDDCMMHWVNMGDWSGVLDHLPKLEELRVRGDRVTYGTIDLPSLRVFARESCTMKNEELIALGEARWPALERLELWFGSSHYAVNIDLHALDSIFAAHGLAKLRHLGLRNCDLHAAIVPVLSSSRLLRQLESLDLSGGTIATREVDILVAHASDLRHLATIDLTDNFISVEDCRRLRGALPNANVTKQREDEDDDDDEPMRYVIEYE
ncbi:MAG: hypothetical protein QM831_07955 [Kofleriaceae bacterium]